MDYLNIVDKIYQGNNIDIIKKMPPKSINCIVTSPPYFNFRSYDVEPVIFDGDQKCEHVWEEYTRKGVSGGKTPYVSRKGKENLAIVDDEKQAFCKKCGAWRGSLGREPKIDLYIKHLCDLFDECKRVLTDDGSLWVNIGDGYNQDENDENADISIPLKSRMFIPWRFAIEMLNRGWICRNEVIWHKSNPIPSSITTKMTPDYEPFFWFVKSNNPLYWVNKKTLEIIVKKPNSKKEGVDWGYTFCKLCKGTGVYESNTCKQCKGTGKKIENYWIVYDYYYNQLRSALKQPKAKSKNATNKAKGYGNPTYSGFEWDASNYDSKNMRTVWNIAYEPIKEKHFAPFPTELVRRPLIGTCPERVCTKCGIPEIQIYDYILENGKVKRKFIGYAKCNCKEPFKKGIIFDPFIGSGTTAIVAIKNSRNYCGTELSKKYVKIIENRINPYKGIKKLDDFRKSK